ncbi:MAG: nickel-responsive transcriptional regulator NikR [Deltaproteobacteria bacterium]|nr:nickel-responsive transcriptional regulator NikR [Deltaproteobacteria bacterium]MBW2122329.1 nickel-responsive transcriptional regulator NikR [Deltaproteobacteria bacterium]
MSKLIRFGISMDERLLMQFDEMVAQKGHSNRSEAIRDLIRDRLVEAAWKEEDKEVVGTITLVYNHEVHELSDRLIDIQHQYHDRIISSVHVHLDPHNCLEVLIVKGKGKDVKGIAERLIGVKGVKHGKLLTTTTGEGLF